jgi:putative ABC transport system permease protein
MDDLRFAIRRLSKQPGATVVSILALAVSIGAAAATWSLLSAVLLHPLPVHDPERLVVAGLRVTTGRDAGALRTGFIYPYFPHLRDSGIFERVAAEWSPPLALLVSTRALPAQTRVSFVSHDYFDVLGIRIPSGRSFTTRDDGRGAPPVAVLTDRYWRLAFDSSPDAIGRTITVAGQSATIIGVAAPGFRGLNLAAAPDLYLPLQTIGAVGGPMTNYFAEAGHASSPTAGVSIVGRFAKETSRAQADARLAVLTHPPASSAARPGSPVPPAFGLVDVNTYAVPAPARAGMTQFITLLASTVALLLLIGSGTVGMLMLVRTEARREEFAMCVALGASRGRLARGVGIEGALLAIGGSLLAIPVARWLFDGGKTFQLPGGVDIGLLELSIDMRVVAAAAGAAVAATLLITLVAGILGLSADVNDALRSGSGSTRPVARRRTRGALVTAQVAIAMVLVVGAGLFARSLIAALSLNPAFATARIVTTDISLAQYGYDAPRARGFFDELIGRLGGNPAIAAVALSESQGGMTPAGSLVIDGSRRQFPSMVSFTAVDDRYFDAIGVRVTEGRDFTADDRQASPRVAIVSASFGRMMSPGGSPLGLRMAMPRSQVGKPADLVEVVGVVPDIITNVSVAEPLAMYFPLSQQAGGTSRTVTMLATVDADAARRESMTAIRQIDRAVSPGPMLTMEERIGRQMSAQHFGAVVLGALSVIAVLLTSLGTYVLAESMAVLRMREMGIRAALGARRSQLAAIVLAETGRLIGAGLLGGLLLAWLGAGTIRALLFRVAPLDPIAIGGAASLVFTLGLVVTVRPALRAAYVDLARVLKED